MESTLEPARCSAMARRYNPQTWYAHFWLLQLQSTKKFTFYPRPK
jgi:hypothetical protein